MDSLGQILRRLREEKGEPLRKVAAFLDIDQAILSKIETGKRKAGREQLEKLAEYFGADKKKLMVAWLSDRILYQVADSDFAEDAIKAAEEHIRYLKTPGLSLAHIKNAVKKELKKFPVIKKAWLFGSFARNEATYKSDIDLMIDVPSKSDFSLFDMFEIQHNLETALQRKVDIVMKDAIKPFALETAQYDLKLIYDRA